MYRVLINTPAPQKIITSPLRIVMAETPSLKVEDKSPEHVKDSILTN